MQKKSCLPEKVPREGSGDPKIIFDGFYLLFSFGFLNNFSTKAQFFIDVAPTCLSSILTNLMISQSAGWWAFLCESFEAWKNNRKKHWRLDKTNKLIKIRNKFQIKSKLNYKIFPFYLENFSFRHRICSHKEAQMLNVLKWFPSRISFGFFNLFAKFVFCYANPTLQKSHTSTNSV